MCLFQLGKVVIDFKQALQIMENYENLKLFEILWRYAIVSGDAKQWSMILIWWGHDMENINIKVYCIKIINLRRDK